MLEFVPAARLSDNEVMHRARAFFEEEGRPARGSSRFSMQKHQMLERQRRELFPISPPSRGGRGESHRPPCRLPLPARNRVWEGRRGGRNAVFSVRDRKRLRAKREREKERRVGKGRVSLSLSKRRNQLFRRDRLEKMDRLETRASTLQSYRG